MANIIQLRRDTAVNWVSADPVLAIGEPALEIDTGKEKIGDGSTVWSSLAYKQSGSSSNVDIVMFNPSIKADGIEYFEDYTQVGVINLTKDASVSDSVAGDTIPNNGYHGIVKSNGNAINHTNDFDFIVKDSPSVDQKMSLTAIWRGKRFSCSLKAVEEPSDTTPPIFSALSIHYSGAYADLTISKGVYGDDAASLPALLADFNISFDQNGGTAINWIATSIKKNDNEVEGSASALVGGESIIRIFGTLSGTIDTNEQLTVTPTNAVSVYDVHGNAMSDTETITSNFTVWKFSDLGDELELFIDGSTIGSDGSVVDGSNNVGTWSDQSGNNRDFVQAVTNDKPLWDGSSKVTFDGVSENLSVVGSKIQAWLKNIHDGTKVYDIAVKMNIPVVNPDTVLWFLTSARITNEVGILLAYEDRSSASNNDNLRISVHRGDVDEAINNKSSNGFFPTQTTAWCRWTIDAGNGVAADRSKIYNETTSESNNVDAFAASTADAAHDLNLGFDSLTHYNFELFKLVVCSREFTAQEWIDIKNR